MLEESRLAVVCLPNLSTLSRLFIEQNLSREITESQARKNHPSRPTTRATRTVSFDFIAPLFIITIIIIIKVCLARADGHSEIRTNLPTVIVRGFLNYRTTVDGTVLLFTPDAGGNAASGSQTTQVISSTPTLVQVSMSTGRVSQASRIEPTGVHFQLNPTSPIPLSEPTLNEQQPSVRDRSESTPALADEWRPIQATPPLRPMQTAFRPIFPSTTKESFSGSLALVNVELNATDHNRQPSGAHLVSSEDSNNSGVDSQAQPDLQKSTPSVQSEDVIADELQPTSGSLTRPPSSPSVGSGTSNTVPETISARATRPKRPSLGFTGQGLRSKSANSRPQTNNQAEAQMANTINGIRRPGLSIAATTNTNTTTTTTTTTTTATVTTTTPAPESNNTSAFHGRLTNASAKLRNRFKRPPVGGNSSLSLLTAKSTPNAALMQPAESGEDIAIGGDQLVGISVQAISPEQTSSLQLRMGDIFNPGASIGISPVVGSDEVLSINSAGESGRQGTANSNSPVMITDSATNLSSSSQQDQSSSTDSSLGPSLSEQPQQESMKPLSRSGEQRPPDNQEPHLQSGVMLGTIELQQGQLGNMPLTFDGFFQNDQPQAAGQQQQHATSADSSEHHPSHRAKIMIPKSTKNDNEKLSSWLDHHHNKFVPRQANHQHQESGHLSQNHQLAANLNNLTPSFASNIPVSTTVKQPSPLVATSELQSLKPSVGSLDEIDINKQPQSKPTNITNLDGSDGSTDSVQMQTITKTYSTVMTSIKTRLVPLQVKSSTAIHTITENYIITKVLTAYQTMPIGEFILPEPLSTRGPFEMFNDSLDPVLANQKTSSAREQPIVAPSNYAASQSVESHSQADQQEQPISLDTSPKSANDWLHDFSDMQNANLAANQQHQHGLAASMLEQQAQEANLAGFSLGEPLDQLASSLDPAALLADGTINIPDLNNPLVLAAAIQNPQLAAVILAAQQLQLKQRNNKLNANAANSNNNNQNQQNFQQAAVHSHPSYSTSLSTVIKPSIYTVRDTMYTTRLVSFKDGRTVRTRTVSEPGSVIEQVLTTMATEVTPVTITIRPTGMLTLPSSLATVQTAGGQAPQSSQSTINNALFATQLASILARRQQQIQPGMLNPNFLAAGSNAMNSQPPLNQLLALQQLINQQQRQQQTAKQFQPNLQQLLQSMQQQPPSISPSSLSPGVGLANNNRSAETSGSPSQKRLQEAAGGALATPVLPSAPIINSQSLPIITTLTNLQVRTYTVHNAFKTIYRTITSTQLITSTIFPAVRNSQLANMG